MGFVSFFLYNLSNLLLIVLVPKDIAKEFLNYYSLASGIFSFLVFYNFSKKNYIKNIYVIILSFLILIYSIYYENLLLITTVYVFVLLYGDYYFSQSKEELLNFIFKFSLLVSTLIILLDFNIFQVLKIKILILAVFLSFLFFKKSSFKTLKVNSPVIYSLCTCFIYFGALFITSVISSSDIVKIFYISIQVFLGLKLKIFDMNIRNIKFQFFNINKFFDYSSLVFFAIISFYYKELVFIGIYLVSNTLLNYVRKKFITQIK